MNKHEREKLATKVLIMSGVLCTLFFIIGFCNIGNSVAIPLLIIATICFAVGFIAFFVMIFNIETIDEKIKR